MGIILVSAAIIAYLFLGPATTDIRGKWVSFGENKLRISASSLRILWSEYKKGKNDKEILN